ncbi:MAG TPA: hypothetical protein ENH32_01870 [Proteobacteria bacterium]|nr:hypothetical protein [Pseudomonadota bacterium]
MLLVGVFLLAFGLSVYRYFFHILGAVAGIAGGLASRDALLGLNGLSKHPMAATVLIFSIFILIGMFLATRFRKILAFLAGLGAGAVLYRAALSLWSGSPPGPSVFHVQGFGPMELLAGLTAAVLFVLFESVFALILTSAVGAALCTLVLGGRWTFAVLMLIGVVAQPLVSRRIVPSPPGKGGNGGSRTTTLMILLLVLVLPAASRADLKVRKVNPPGKTVALENYDNKVVSGSEDAVEKNAREERLAFLKAVEGGGEDSFRRFLKNYPENPLISGMTEARLYLDAVEKDRVYACQDFIARYPDGELAGKCKHRISLFRKWEHELEFGSEPVKAIRFFGEYGDESAVPLLVRRLSDPGLGPEARASILKIGPPALRMLMEVLISPLQTISLKDEVVSIIAEMEDITAIPALRTYVGSFHTEAGGNALKTLEEMSGR